jgi:transposase
MCAMPLIANPEIRKKLLDAIRAGNYYLPACASAGLSYDAFHRALQRGERAEAAGETDNVYAVFRREVLQAEAEAEIEVVRMWRDQCPEEWQASRDFLARRHPERWANRENLKVEGKVEAITRPDLSNLTDEELDQLGQLLERASESRRRKDGESQETPE